MRLRFFHLEMLVGGVFPLMILKVIEKTRGPTMVMGKPLVGFSLVQLQIGSNITRHLD
jgi:hypothetical protein